MIKNVHTEHCCILHGCKYGDDEICTVINKKSPQSYICEMCNDDMILSVTEAQERAELYKKTDVRTTYNHDQRTTAVNVLWLRGISFDQMAYLTDSELDALMKEKTKI